jgi:hypothetical protein
LRYRFIASLVAATLSLAFPAIVQAAAYTINVPVQLTKVALPAGSKFQVACVVYPTATAGDLYMTNPASLGVSMTPPLDTTGSVSATVTVRLVANTPMKSYRCGLLPPTNVNASIKQLLPNADPQGVSGTFP